MKKHFKILCAICFMLVGLCINNITATAAITTITEGTYTLKNLGTGKYLNVYANKDANNTNIDIYQKDNTVGQDFKIYKYGDSYALSPLSSSKGRVVNVYTEKAKSGNNVCLWDRTNHSTQLWKFDKVSDGYVIRCADNTKLVLNATGSKNSSNVNVITYDSKNKNQIWVLENPATVKTDTTNNTVQNTPSQLKITSPNYPNSIYKGDTYSCKGTITSNYNITNVTGMILKSDAKTAVYKKSVNPKAKSYNLYNSAIDKAMLFNKLGKGTYYYKVTATDASGKTLALINNKKFEVKQPAGLTDSQLKKQIKNTHTKAKTLSKRKSFDGYCGLYVYWQLRARGIYSGKSSKYEKAVNGNKWYELLSNKKYTQSTGGYKLTKYAGINCLDTLSNKGKKEVYNIVVSYKVQYGKSLKKPGAGHVIYIHAIKNGKVYLSESYKYGSIKEGQPIVIKYSTFKSQWTKSYKQTTGAVVFTK